MNKSLILNKIKEHYGFKRDVDFAEFLGIAQNTLSNWHRRGSMDFEKIITKCEDIDGNWLLTGKGAMTLDERNKIAHSGDDFQIKYINVLEENNRLLKENLKLKERLLKLGENPKAAATARRHSA